MICLQYDVLLHGKWRHNKTEFRSLLELADFINVLLSARKLRLSEDSFIVRIYETDK